MKHRIFNRSLYLDALKQTRIFTVLCVTVLLFITLAAPIDTIINYPARQTVAFENFAPVLITLPYAVTPVLCVILFGFMNKRKSSDFYHSIADNRISLYLSLFSAVITVIAGIILITVIPSLLLHCLYKKIFIINLKSILINIFGIFSSSLYCAAIVTIAMSLTGTLLTNIAVSGILLFLPDLIVAATTSTVCQSIPVLRNQDIFGKYMPVGFNIPSFILFGSGNWIEIFEDLSKNITTFIISVPLIIISVLVFKTRKSEGAGYPTQNRHLQSAFRIICAFIVSFFATILIFDSIITDNVYSERIYYLILIYIAAVLVYFIAELITTKFKNLIRIIPGLSIVVLLNIVLLGTLYGAYNITLSFTPKADEIDYIRFTNNYYGDDLKSYYTKKTESIKINNDEINKLIAECLNNDINEIKSNTYYSDYSSDYYYEVMPVIISVNGKERIRQIKITESELSYISNELKNNAEYRKVYSSIPALNAFTGITYYADIKNIKDAERIYNLMRKEVSELDFETWYTMVNGTGGTALDEGFTISTVVDSQSIDIFIPFYIELKESTLEYIKLTSTKEEQNKILNAADNIENLDYLRAELFIGTNTYYFEFVPDQNDEGNEKILEFISDLSPTIDLEEDTPIIAVYADFLVANRYGGYWDTVASYFNYTGDTDKLLEDAGYLSR